MLRIRPSALIAASCALALSLAAQAAPPTKAEQTLKYRKSLYQVMAWNFGPMSAMAQGKIPYDAKEFAMRAERVATVAPMLSESFPRGVQGRRRLGTEARDVDQPRRLRREDEGPRRQERRARDGREDR